EELASLGHSISSDDFAAMILSSVPMSYEPTLSAMTASAKVSRQDLPPEVIMSTLLNSYDLCQTKLPKKSTSRNDDAAYSVNASKKFTGSCNNCSKKGHKAEDCWAEGGRKAGQQPKKKWKPKEKGKEEAATADATDGEPDGVWLVNAATSDDEDDCLGTGQHMILFDSGTSHHMSSYCEQFTNFKSIAPKPITAADKHTFEAIGKGDLTIYLPNGSSCS
ncbi:hypothetical protein SCLCIDRAFT_115539, partial [Scleroderma citrinum Foug A]